MKTKKLDRCPRCKGSLMREKDQYGLYEQCMQCGYIHDLPTMNSVDKQRNEGENIASKLVTADISDREPRCTPQLANDYSYIETLKLPPELLSVLNDLLKARQKKNRIKVCDPQLP